jgi:hypothetical protein
MAATSAAREVRQAKSLAPTLVHDHYRASRLDSVNLSAVIPGRAVRREPGIHNHRL